MHREISHASPSDIVDHINHDTLDNRRSNLRLVDTAENLLNRRLPVGVTWCPVRNNWRAVLHMDGKYMNLGRYSSEEEARFVYESVKEARLKWRRVNNPR